MSNNERISEYLQIHLHNEGREDACAVEAAKWLDETGILKDRPSRRGQPLRRLLRKGLLRASSDARGIPVDVSGGLISLIHLTIPSHESEFQPSNFLRSRGSRFFILCASGVC